MLGKFHYAIMRRFYYNIHPSRVECTAHSNYRIINRKVQFESRKDVSIARHARRGACVDSHVSQRIDSTRIHFDTVHFDIRRDRTKESNRFAWPRTSNGRFHRGATFACCVLNAGAPPCQFNFGRRSISEHAGVYGTISGT
jgi:hypothetical protein